jgi:putative transposase
LIKFVGLKSIVRVKKYKSYKGERGKIALNILRRNFRVPVPNQKSTPDLIELNISGNKLHLSSILDLSN